MIDLASKIRAIPDFPKEGIIFRDITTLLADVEGWRATVDRIVEACADLDVQAVAGIEARGFALAGPVAYRLGARLVLVRKPGKLPRETLRETYALEYGEDALEIHADALSRGERVLILDDLLATGGTAAATVRLVERLGARVMALGFIIELDELQGRRKLPDQEIISLIHY